MQPFRSPRVGEASPARSQWWSRWSFTLFNVAIASAFVLLILAVHAFTSGTDFSPVQTVRRNTWVPLRAMQAGATEIGQTLLGNSSVVTRIRVSEGSEESVADEEGAEQSGKSRAEKSAPSATPSAPEQEQKWPWEAPPDSPELQALLEKKLLDDEDMPDINSGPWMPNWKNTVAICTVMKEENATDIREWLLYHKWLGVDRVFVYEHYTKEPLAEHPALQDMLESGFMAYEQTDTFDRQAPLFHHCLMKHRAEFNWMAFIDADEYMVLRKTGKGMLKTFLEDYKFYGGLSMNWIMMGWNNREFRPEHGGVMRYYTMCDPEPSKIIKTMVNTWFAIGGKQVHNFRYRGYMSSVNEDGKPVPLMCKQKNNKTAWEAHPGCAMKSSRSIENPLHRTAEKIGLFHFFSKSKQDYKIKMAKGLAAGHNTRTMDHFRKMSVQGQVIHPMCEELSQVADDCCPLWKGPG